MAMGVRGMNRGYLTDEELNKHIDWIEEMLKEKNNIDIDICVGCVQRRSNGYDALVAGWV